jgi:predicted nuclease of restriction endonuclease-like (RecB) superfamily
VHRCECVPIQHISRSLVKQKRKTCVKKQKKDIATGNSTDFEEIISIVERARENTFRLVNRELISLFWEIGKYISCKLKGGSWGKSVVEEFARFVQAKRPDIKGFSASNVWRMRQFYETYCNNEKLATLSREITWSNNLLIMSRAESEDAREFYLLWTHNNNYSTRELERQIDSMLFERTIISDVRNKQFMSKNSGLTALRDSYVMEFLDVPVNYREKELRRSIVANIRDFILEFGKEFAFVGEEYRIQVGNKDFHIDLVLYNRKLSCLVAIELKVVDFRPEHLGQLEFYLEALDRDVKRPNENPSVGIILCAGKDDTVVEYALSRSMSPALVAAYQLCLPNRALLEKKLRELKECTEFIE